MDRFRFSKEDIEKRGLAEWLRNYWFYYKWVTLIVVCSLILGVSMIYSMATDMEYDASVYLVCRSDTAPALDSEAIQNKFENYAGDYDGKHGINIRFGFTALPVITEENTNVEGLESELFRSDEETQQIGEYLASTAAFAAEMDSDTAIYIFDEVQYNELMADAGRPIFVNLKERYPDLPVVDEDKIMVRDTIFAGDFEAVSDEFFFVLRDLQYIRDSHKENVQEHYAFQEAMFDAVIAASFPEE